MNHTLISVSVSAMVIVLGWLPASGASCYAHSEQEYGRVGKTIESFEVEQVTLVDALLRLAQQHHLPLGIEYVDLEALREPIKLKLTQTSIAEALDAIVAQSKGYEWRLSEGVVIVSHVGVPSGRGQNLLDRTLPQFAIPKCTLAEASNLLRMALDRDLHPDIRGWAGSYNPGSGEKLIGPLTLRNVTVREALNRLVHDLKDAAWVIHVPPGNLDKLPNHGLWTVIEYERPPKDYSHFLQQRILAFKPTGNQKR